jgi:hypothetical protein
MTKRNALLIQKLMGIVLLVMGAIVLFTDIAYDPITQTKDGTTLLFFVPLGLYLLFTKQIVITVNTK